MTSTWRLLKRQVHANRLGLAIGAALCFATLASFALHGLLSDLHRDAISVAFQALRPWQITVAVVLTAVSYALLTCYDVVALRIIGRPLPYRTAALASLTSYTLGHNLGLAMLTGGSARYRIYSAAGLRPSDVVQIVASASLSFWAGVLISTAAALSVSGSALTIMSVVIAPALHRAIGAAVLVLVGALLLTLRRVSAIRIGRWSLALPSPRQSAALIVVATVDMAIASAALFVLVPDMAFSLFPTFFLAYVLAVIATLISHVPGGVGVFEAVIIASLPSVDPSSLVAALVAYRVVYYLLPLIGATIWLAYHERRVWQQPVSNALSATHAAAASFAPVLLAALAFVGGAILLVSGSLPALPDRLRLLRDLVPLPFVEASHIAASLAGTGLLLLAPGLYRRLDGAFLLTRTLLLAGAVFSLIKGFDFEEMSVLLVITALLQWMRPAFYRHTRLTQDALSARWLAAVAGAFGLSVWIGLLAFKHVDYQHALWWDFAWHGSASRFMRASLAVAVLFIAVILVRLFGAVAPRADLTTVALPGPGTFDNSDRTEAMLALTGDKRFLYSPSAKTFLMYQVQGHSWIVMGDPIGPHCEWADLLWRLRDLADAMQGRLMLYQITTAVLPISIDLGLQLVKYGEEARVELATFDLNGPGAKSLRYTERRAAREGATFAILPASTVRTYMPELQAVSDAWLAAKGGSEKAFSSGRFDPDYLSRFDCAVVRSEGRIVAFANIWAAPSREEISVDLMRHALSAPYGAMDFLFIRLMQWAKSENYRWFTLGLAPLSGIEARRLSPIWARAGSLIYRHGEALYGFEGLRAYKDKFLPVWEPRYIAGPSGLGMARALIDLQTLVGGGRASAARPRRLRLVA